jgi:hypothetical protein
VRWCREFRSGAFCLLRRSCVCSPVSVLAGTCPGTVPRIQIHPTKDASRAFLVGHSSRESETTGERFGPTTSANSCPVFGRSRDWFRPGRWTTQPLGRFGEVQGDRVLPSPMPEYRSSREITYMSCLAMSKSYDLSYIRYVLILLLSPTPATLGRGNVALHSCAAQVPMYKRIP